MPLRCGVHLDAVHPDRNAERGGRWCTNSVAVDHAVAFRNRATNSYSVGGPPAASQVGRLVHCCAGSASARASSWLWNCGHFLPRIPSRLACNWTMVEREVNRPRHNMCRHSSVGAPSGGSGAQTKGSDRRLDRKGSVAEGKSVSLSTTCPLGRYSIPASVIAQSSPCSSYRPPCSCQLAVVSRRLYATDRTIARCRSRKTCSQLIVPCPFQRSRSRSFSLIRLMTDSALSFAHQIVSTTGVPSPGSGATSALTPRKFPLGSENRPSPNVELPAERDVDHRVQARADGDFILRKGANRIGDSHRARHVHE